MSVRIDHDGPVTTIVIDRPERRNAVDAATAVALRAAFAAFEADDTARVALLYGEGGTFCAGYDLKSLGDAPIVDAPGDDGPMGPTRMDFAKPVIAAIEGHAVAGGLELALMCDLRVAGDSAVFGVFCRRWGVPLIDGGTIRLPRAIGHARALDMILTGRPVDAREALAWGLANRVVPGGTARAAAEALAHDIARFPQICMRADRASSYAQWGLATADALAFEARGGAGALRDEGLAGAASFAGGLGRGGDFGRIS